MAEGIDLKYHTRMITEALPSAQSLSSTSQELTEDLVPDQLAIILTALNETVQRVRSARLDIRDNVAIPISAEMLGSIGRFVRQLAKQVEYQLTNSSAPAAHAIKQALATRRISLPGDLDTIIEEGHALADRIESYQPVMSHYFKLDVQMRRDAGMTIPVLEEAEAVNQRCIDLKQLTLKYIKKIEGVLRRIRGDAHDL